MSGQRDGEEVVQVYLRRPGDKEGPSLYLACFQTRSYSGREKLNQ